MLYVHTLEEEKADRHILVAAGRQEMKDKSLIQIAFEFLVGILLMIPLILINCDKTFWIVTCRILYSFGIMLAMTKLMNIVYRMIACIFRRVMLFHQKSYWILYFIFICLGVVVWNMFSSYFAKGYLVSEIVAYVLFVLWFLLDMHTTKCFAYISFLEGIINLEVMRHRKYVDTYKNDMSSISVRKEALVKELEPHFPKKFLVDPLKDLRRQINFTHIDKYLQRIPSFRGAYKGIDGFLSGQENINRFENAVECYLGNIADDEQWMDNEKETYDGYISGMEKIVTTIKKSGQQIATLSELGFDTNQYQKILEGDIAVAENNRRNIKQFWKMNKKINRMRRRNYGR